MRFGIPRVTPRQGPLFPRVLVQQNIEGERAREVEGVEQFGLEEELGLEEGGEEQKRNEEVLSPNMRMTTDQWAIIRTKQRS